MPWWSSTECGCLSLNNLPKQNISNVALKWILDLGFTKLLHFFLSNGFIQYSVHCTFENRRSSAALYNLYTFIQKKMFWEINEPQIVLSWKASLCFYFQEISHSNIYKHILKCIKIFTQINVYFRGNTLIALLMMQSLK